MISDRAELNDAVCHLGEREAFGCQGYDLWHLLAFLPALICAQNNPQLFSCPCLCPVHALSPELQFKPVHSSPRDVQIFRNSPGEILANYEYFALHEVGFL